MACRIMVCGEPLGLLRANEEGALKDVSSFSFSTAGAELNVAIGLARLGHPVSYVSCVGKDPFGDAISDELKREGVDISRLRVSSDRPTGFMLKARAQDDDPATFYYRQGSAASAMTPGEVRDINWSSYQFLHLTGIYPAICEQSLEITKELIVQARQNRVTISLDPNLRPSLWPSLDVMRTTIGQLADMVDVFLPGRGEATFLINKRAVEDIAKHYLSRGVRLVVIKDGAHGAYACTHEERRYVPSFRVDHVVDPVGAGDAFAAGVIDALCRDLSLQTMLTRAAALGASQLMYAGDHEGMLTQDELESFIKDREETKE